MDSRGFRQLGGDRYNIVRIRAAGYEGQISFNITTKRRQMGTVTNGLKLDQEQLKQLISDLQEFVVNPTD